MNKYQKVMEHVKVDDDMKNRILQNIENEMKDVKTSGGTADAGDEKRSGQDGAGDKIRPFRSRIGAGLRRYGGLAAMFAILIVAAAAVIQITGDVKNTSSTVSYESSPSDSGMMESESAAEAPASAESEMHDAEYAAESDMSETEYPAESAMSETEYAAEEPASAESAEYDGTVKEEAPVMEAESAAEPSVNTDKADNMAGSTPAPVSEPAAGIEPPAPESSETLGVHEAENEITPQPSAAKVLFAVLLPILLLAAVVAVVILVIRKIKKRK